VRGGDDGCIPRGHAILNRRKTPAALKALGEVSAAAGDRYPVAVLRDPFTALKGLNNMFTLYPDDPAQFPPTFDANFAAVDALSKEARCALFFDRLSDITGIERDIIVLECKRYLMVTVFTAPERVQRGGQFLAVVRFGVRVIADFVWGIYHGRPHPSVTLYIDDWSPGVPEEFYGTELVGRLYAAQSVSVCDWSLLRGIRMGDLPRLLTGFFRLLPFQRAYFRQTGVSLYDFSMRALCSAFEGRFINPNHLHGVVVSGNDNGFNVLKAKAAHLRVILVQNGLRGYIPDSSFKYADVYVAMGARQIVRAQQDVGVRWGKTYFWGSLRLAHYMATVRPAQPVLYDIAWISNWPINLDPSLCKGYYKAEYERDAIVLLLELANSSSLNIVYHCRYAKEIEDLKYAGLYSPRITYVTRSEQSVYAIVEQSRIIVSTGSTVNLEAMALGKKVCFVNLSPNGHLIKQFSALDREYVRGSSRSFADFIKDIDGRPARYDDYVFQSPRMVDDLAALILAEVGANALVSLGEQSRSGSNT
jgi:hypothetical protein